MSPRNIFACAFVHVNTTPQTNCELQVGVGVVEYGFMLQTRARNPKLRPSADGHDPVGVTSHRRTPVGVKPVTDAPLALCARRYFVQHPF